MALCQLFVAIASFLAAVAVNSNAADVGNVLPTCESVNATDTNCKVYCRDNGYDTTLDGSVGGSVYDEYENSWTGVGSHSCLCKNMGSFDMTTVCQTIVSTASPTATPVPCNVSDFEAVRADDGSLPTCASMGITKITCHEACRACGDNGSTWSWGVSDSIGRCECGTFDSDIYWLCADQELPSGASASSGFMAISVTLFAAVLV
ncbi:hypothetical protein QTG54_016801 [Skeletonema marinoi]|uniref:Uncharacterized protein n=1 Tax=Skeletonema marinoi TaxID=267567 RepID=A0AAD8XRY4_9STRA|nr:hypothetical protein QTG54_016801 [Skeletonema marinoi]